MSVNLYSAFDMFLMDAQTNRVKETIKTYNALKTMLLEYDPRLDFTSIDQKFFDGVPGTRKP